jgi:hypothetical protein
MRARACCWNLEKLADSLVDEARGRDGYAKPGQSSSDRERETSPRNALDRRRTASRHEGMEKVCGSLIPKRRVFGTRERAKAREKKKNLPRIINQSLHFCDSGPWVNDTEKSVFGCTKNGLAGQTRNREHRPTCCTQTPTYRMACVPRGWSSRTLLHRAAWRP